MVFSWGLALLVFSLVSGVSRFWEPYGYTLYGAFRFPFLFVVLPLLVLGFRDRRFRIEPFALVLIFVFFTDWIDREWQILNGTRGAVLLFTAVGLAVLPVYRSVVVGFLAICTYELVKSGVLIFSDDHGPVFFRLSLLKSEFPFIPFYYPFWNLGLDARDFFATGILNLYFLALPIIELFPLEGTYNFIVAGVLFLVLPVSTVLGMRSLSFSRTEQLVGAILSVSTSLLWYRWALKYGSMGFVTSASLLPLVVALLIKLVSKRDITKIEVVLLSVSGTLMIFWSPSGLAIIPLLVAGLLYIRSILRIAWIKGAIVFVCLVNIPWILLFVSVSKVGTFLKLPEHSMEYRDAGIVEEKPAHTSRSVKWVGELNAKKSLRYYLGNMNPLILFLMFPGLMLLPRDQRFLFSSIIIWLWALGTVGNAYKPQLELDRMMVLSGLIMVFPAARGIGELFKRKSFASAVTFGFLVASCLSVLGVVNNRSAEYFAFRDPSVLQLSEAIQNNTGEGRAVFVGFVLHELSRGHLAPLSVMTQKPLVASSPFHNLWWYTELVPENFLRQGNSGIERYLNLVNATLVITHEDKWREIISELGYPKVGDFGRFTVYRRLHPSQYVLEGEAESIKQQTSSITIVPKSETLVLSFAYHYFLESDNCQISSASDLIPGMPLIKLSNCEIGTPVTVKAKSGFRRLWSS
jgi:hypothetical protein